jgi:hypothetical protein
MARRAQPDDVTAHRRCRAADTARWRSRRRRCVELYSIECGPDEIDLAIKFGGLKESRITDRVAVSVGLGKLLHRAIICLLREENRRR